MSANPPLAAAVRARLKALTPQNIHVAAGPPPKSKAEDVAWPWTIASAGADYLAGPQGALAYGLGDMAVSFLTTPDGQALASTLANYDWSQERLDPSVVGAVQGSTLYGQALSQVQGDELMRSALFGVVHGVDVILGGEEGSSGLAVDVASTQDLGGYTYEIGQIGPSIGGTIGLSVGAVCLTPAAMSTSVTALSVGVSYGPGLLVTVLMSGDVSSLIGFVVGIGVGAAVTGDVGWGTSWAF